MGILSNEIKQEIREMVYEFFVEECEVERDEISDNTLVIDDLDGDSLMFVELVEILKQKYGLSIKMQTIGKYLLKNPANTIADVINTCYLVYEKENDIVSEN